MGALDGFKEVTHQGDEDMRLFAQVVSEEDVHPVIEYGLHHVPEGHVMSGLEHILWDEPAEYVVQLSEVITRVVALIPDQGRAQALMKEAVHVGLHGGSPRDVCERLFDLVEHFDGGGFDGKSEGFEGMLRFTAVLLAATRIADSSMQVSAEREARREQQDSAN